MRMRKDTKEEDDEEEEEEVEGEEEDEEDQEEDRGPEEEVGADNKVAVQKEGEGMEDEKSGDKVECNYVRLQGDGQGGIEEIGEVEISEEEATLVGLDEEDGLGLKTNIYDEQGEFFDTEDEPRKRDSEEKDKEERFGEQREENSQLLKDIGLQVIKANQFIAHHNFHKFPKMRHSKKAKLPFIYQSNFILLCSHSFQSPRTLSMISILT